MRPAKQGTPKVHPGNGAPRLRRPVPDAHEPLPFGSQVMVQRAHLLRLPLHSDIALMLQLGTDNNSTHCILLLR